MPMHLCEPQVSSPNFEFTYGAAAPEVAAAEPHRGLHLVGFPAVSEPPADAPRDGWWTRLSQAVLLVLGLEQDSHHQRERRAFRSELRRSWPA